MEPEPLPAITRWALATLIVAAAVFWMVLASRRYRQRADRADLAPLPLLVLQLLGAAALLWLAVLLASEERLAPGEIYVWIYAVDGIAVGTIATWLLVRYRARQQRRELERAGLPTMPERWPSGMVAWGVGFVAIFLVVPAEVAVTYGLSWLAPHVMASVAPQAPMVLGGTAFVLCVLIGLGAGLWQHRRRARDRRRYHDHLAAEGISPASPR